MYTSCGHNFSRAISKVSKEDPSLNYYLSSTCIQRQYIKYNTGFYPSMQCVNISVKYHYNSITTAKLLRQLKINLCLKITSVFPTALRSLYQTILLHQTITKYVLHMVFSFSIIGTNRSILLVSLCVVVLRYFSNMALHHQAITN